MINHSTDRLLLGCRDSWGVRRRSAVGRVGQALLVFGLISVGLLVGFGRGSLPTHAAAWAPNEEFCETVVGIPQAECMALVRLYEATDGPNWYDHSGWLETQNPCTWYGVQCTPDESSVTQIILVDNQLSGTIPAEIVQLSGLEVLDLSFNLNLRGSIPDQIGDPQVGLLGLRGLSLYGNELTGTIPANLGNLRALETLELQNNKLSGPLPEGLAQLSALRRLLVSDNQLTGTIPVEITGLGALTTLDLSSNLLEGSIPRQMGNLSALISLNLANNQLTGTIPAQFDSLTALRTLNLSGNRLTGTVPAELGSLVQLRSLFLAGNALEGEIPASLAMLTNLGENGTDLGYNKLWASDPEMIQFLEQKDPDWNRTQTVPPTDVAVVTRTASEIEIVWATIPYTDHGGYYEIGLAQSPAGPYEVVGRTEDKISAGFTITGVMPSTTYYIAARSFTPIHPGQQNDLWSDYSAPVTSTAEVQEMWHVYLPLVMR